MESIARVVLIATLVALSSCGGGGSDGGGGGGIGNGGDWQAGVYPASNTFDAKCAAPRTGIDPSTQQPFVDTQGTTRDEKNWIRSWSRETYLWYSELPDLNPATNTSVLSYFDSQRTTAITPSGKPKDDFHFTAPTSDWYALSQSGQAPGYGLTWAALSSVPPRNYVVAYVEPGASTPANLAGMSRGARVLAIDGVDIDASGNANIDILSEGLFPSAGGRSHSFTIREVSGATRTVNMTSAAVITTAPVLVVSTIPSANGPVGYILFNDHIAPSEAALVNAINTLRTANVQGLILDLRYNSGGYLDIAAELGYMIGGLNVGGTAFERMQFNDKYPNTNPVTGGALQAVPFFTTGQGFSVADGTPLPSLNLSSVTIISGPDTCSASESIINGLRGANITVNLIGSPTCGKPYGFYPTDNCGTTYFTIQFRGVNAKNFGDYADGFTPTTTGFNDGRLVRGCRVADDFTRALGDPAEARLAAALNYRATGLCPAASATLEDSQTGAAIDSLGSIDGRVYKAPWLENRILRR